MNMNFINAYHVLSTLAEGTEDYRAGYKQYILDHKNRVTKFADWLKTNCSEVFKGVSLASFDDCIRKHDDSKFEEPEFEAYAKFWSNDSEDYDWDPEYDEAVEYHWSVNEHHPEHWFGSDMPLLYILEMICDWGSFYIDKGNFSGLYDFYYSEARDDDEKDLSPKTKKIIEDILDKIKKAGG